RGLELRDVDLDAIGARTEGATPAYIKELLRKAAVLAAAASADGTEQAGLVVTSAHLEMALAELDEGGRLAQRLLGLRPGEPTPGAAELAPGMRPMAPTGFPVSHTVVTRILSP
ncbi:MAG TPA: hypothetical protein VGR57_04825, partial [Ktedonobacterales bacterium]|nr:hypothetical protein [Ktedonobacterales bacterium]